MRANVVSITESGEANVTPELLLGILADTIYQAVRSADFGSPTCASICSALNLLGKLGWIELRERTQPSSSGPDMRTDDPPPFLLDAWQFDKKEGGDGPRDI